MRPRRHLAKRLDLRQPALEEATLDWVGAERNRAAVGVGRCGETPAPAQQVGARGVQKVVAIELAARFEFVDDPEPARGTGAGHKVAHGDRDSGIQLHDRGGL